MRKKYSVFCIWGFLELRGRNTRKDHCTSFVCNSYYTLEITRVRINCQLLISRCLVAFSNPVTCSHDRTSAASTLAILEGMTDVRRIHFLTLSPKLARNV